MTNMQMPMIKKAEITYPNPWVRPYSGKSVPHHGSHYNQLVKSGTKDYFSWITDQDWDFIKRDWTRLKPLSPDITFRLGIPTQVTGPVETADFYLCLFNPSVGPTHTYNETVQQYVEKERREGINEYFDEPDGYLKHVINTEENIPYREFSALAGMFSERELELVREWNQDGFARFKALFRPIYKADAAERRTVYKQVVTKATPREAELLTKLLKDNRGKFDVMLVDQYFSSNGSARFLPGLFRNVYYLKTYFAPFLMDTTQHPYEKLLDFLIKMKEQRQTEAVLAEIKAWQVCNLELFPYRDAHKHIQTMIAAKSVKYLSTCQYAATLVWQRLAAYAEGNLPQKPLFYFRAYGNNWRPTLLEVGTKFFGAERTEELLQWCEENCLFLESKAGTGIVHSDRFKPAGKHGKATVTEKDLERSYQALRANFGLDHQSVITQLLRKVNS